MMTEESQSCWVFQMKKTHRNSPRYITCCKQNYAPTPVVVKRWIKQFQAVRTCVEDVEGQCWQVEMYQSLSSRKTKGKQPEVYLEKTTMCKAVSYS